MGFFSIQLVLAEKNNRETKMDNGFLHLISVALSHSVGATFIASLNLQTHRIGSTFTEVTFLSVSIFGCKRF